MTSLTSPLFQGSHTSIVKIAGAGLRLSLLLNAAACQLAQSKLEIHSIAKGISLFALSLKDAGKTLEVTGFHRTPEATEKAWEIAGQGQMIFIEIEHMLDMLKSTDRDDDLRSIPLQERLKWCFQKQHVTYLLAQLDSLKLSLIVLLQILQLGNIIKSNVDDGIDTESLASVADDTIAQEKADSQNMIIVRYWSLKRLDRLWDLVEQEARDAANSQTNQRIRSNYLSSSASALKPLVTATRAADPIRLPIVTFGESEVGLSDMERSPKDMVQLSESAMNRLLSIWVPLVDLSKLQEAGKLIDAPEKPTQPRVYVSSDTDDDDTGSDFEGLDVRGYYIEGSTPDWRVPHSQEARQQAAERRRKYSNFQARVETEPEPEDVIKRGESPNDSRIRIDSSDEGEQRSTLRPSHSKQIPSRIHTSSLSSQYPPNLTNHESRPYPTGSYPPPAHPLPRAPPHFSGPPSSHAQTKSAQAYSQGAPQQPYNPYNTQPYASTPRSIPVNKQAGPSPYPSSRGHSPNQVYFGPTWGQPHAPYQLRRPHPSLYTLSTSTPEMGFQPPSPHSRHRSPTRSRHYSSRSSRDSHDSHDSREPREEAKERRKDLTKKATRGLAGIGAIAGFLDALEAFSLS
ncbi:hypothetical protein PENANT_c013G10939 [Penicillium antarcticum]|uniref:Uncharacterized protein n=1 Tax=Penicillium antarcticum TaxID=416450 RepID=A0A1V6Q5A3_9EURO|nr:uncharacterized protein N7508_004271 [Penicillium antarcticum]KAJ5308892.1 hypothetical protein N7508_004271 [Penicillium antarcticum]OQD84421.1 hypothetical protein PENANT_c013G10939 [Penicillium antarcticum]